MGVPLVIIHVRSIFHEINHPAIGDPQCMETSMYILYVFVLG